MKSDLESRYSRMGDDDLLRIVHSQTSFRADAQELAKWMLLNRGISEDAINQWRDPDAEIVVPAWSHGMSNLELRRMFNRRRLIDRITFYLLIIFGIPWFGILWLLWQSDTPNLKFASWQSLFSFILIFCWPILGCLWLRYILHGFWRNPARILFLRPFSFPENQKQVRLFAKLYLRYLGHTYTISDTSIRPRRAFFEGLQFFSPVLLSVFVAPVPGTSVAQDLFLRGFFTWWIYLMFQPSFDVYWDEDISRLKDFIARKFTRNIAWALSWDKLFKISCTTTTWKHTVQHLINSVQLVIVDLSHIGEGLKRELEELRFYDYIDKAIVIAHEDSEDLARLFLESSGMLERGKMLFVYGDNGLATKHEELETTLIWVAALVRSS